MAQLENIHVRLTGTITAKKHNVNEKEQNESASTSNKTPSSVADLFYLAIANFQNLGRRCS